MLAAVRDGPYDVLLVLHLLTVIVGFGPLMVAGFFGVKAKARGGREGLAVAETTYDVMKTVEWAVYIAPILGIILVLISDDNWKFSQSWISLSFLLYFVALGLSHGLHLPNLRRMNELMAELVAGPAPGSGGGARSGPPPQVAELEERGRRAALIGGILNLIVVAIVALMVFKPGV